MGLPKISYMTCCYVKTKGSDRPAAEEVAERYLFAERKIEGDLRKQVEHQPATLGTQAAALCTQAAVPCVQDATPCIPGDFRKWNTNFGAVIRLSDDALQDLRERDEARGGDGDEDGDGDAPAQTRVKLVTDDVPQAFSHFSLFYPMHT